MSQEVTLPQLGESVTEGTITAWLVEEGDEIEEDQPIFEISTDKIDTEVPSPASGVLLEIKAQVDDTIEVGEVVAIIGEADEASTEDEEDEADEDTEAEDADETAEDTEAEDADEDAEDTDETAETKEAEEDADEADEDADETAEDTGEATADEADEDAEEAETDGEAALLSPIVRRMVREHDLDPSRIEGSGEGGRITRDDVERAIDEGTATREAPAATAEAPARGAPTGRKPHENVRGRSEKLPRVRAAIAKHMWNSLHTTAQLTAAREADITAIMEVRARAKAAFEEREGVSLSPLPFFARAVCMVLPRHEGLNASIDVDAGQMKFYDTINLGIAVDAPQGLIVPNIKDAQDKTVPALAREIAELAERTRSKQITPDDVQGGTFTITNTGSRGVLFDTPVLNPPETGILATPAIEKRPVVVSRDGSDAIAVRYMTYLCLTYDHRMVDGADAARFLADLTETLEDHDWAAEIGV